MPDAPSRPALQPSDARALRQLAHEVRLLLETAMLGPQRVATFGADARRHLQLLRELIRSLPPRPELAAMAIMAWRAWLDLLPATRTGRRLRGRRLVWEHRRAFLRSAAVWLARVTVEGRALEARLWDE